MNKEFWIKCNTRGTYKWDTHNALNTINHNHISCYPDEGDNCDLMIVECANGQFYIEDNWGGDAQGAPEAFNPYDEHASPVFFDNYEDAEKIANKIIEKVCGVSQT